MAVSTLPMRCSPAGQQEAAAALAGLPMIPQPGAWPLAPEALIQQRLRRSTSHLCAHESRLCAHESHAQVKEIVGVIVKASIQDTLTNCNPN